MPPKKKASRSIATERAAEKSKPEKASRSIATERAAEKSKPQALNTQSCAEAKKSKALGAESTAHATDELHHTSSHIATLYRAAYANTSPPQQSLLQQVAMLGHHPKRYKQPANESETASNSLAMKLSKIKSALPAAAQRYLEAMQAVSTATEHAQEAESLMQQVRKLGHLPQESQQKPHEQLLAQQLRKARENGLLEAFEDELDNFASKDAEAAIASTATQHAQHEEALMQQVRKLGHLPQESQSKPQEQLLAQQLRKARASGLLGAFEEELQELVMKDQKAAAASTATEHAQHAEALMQQVHALARMPKESNDPKESRLARELRDARATGLMSAHEPELMSIAAADECRRVIAAATERKKSLAAFYCEVDIAVSQNMSVGACRSLAARLHDFRHDPLLQSTDAQALVKELQWMLIRQRQFLRTANQKIAAKRKHTNLAACRRTALATVKETLRQWRAAEDKCNCNEFSCWQEVWELDPLAAITLRASNHHVSGCNMHQACPADHLDFLCPQCGLVLLRPLRERDLEMHSASDSSPHSSDTGESVESLGDGRVYRKAPVSSFTHGWRIMLGASRHPNMLPDYASDDEEMKRKREQARTEECTCDLPVYGQYKGFFKLGIKATCLYCASTIEAGVLYGGYEAETDRFYWKEFTFHHYLGECGLPGSFPGRTSRQWQATIDEPIFKIPGGIQRDAYEQILNHCAATADFMLHRYRLGLSGKLLRGKPTISTLLMKVRTPGSEYSTFNRFPGVTSPLKQAPEFQFDDADVAKSWSKLQLDLVDEIPPRVLAQLLMDAKAALGRYPQVRCVAHTQAKRTETRVALLWQIWRSRRDAVDEWDVDEWFSVVHDVEEVLDFIMDSGRVPFGEESDAVREELLSGSATDRLATERPAEERTLLAWASDAEAVLTACGLGVAGVDGSRVFFHIPSRPMNVERQKQALIRAGVYHALEICWEPSGYATEQTGLSSGDCWWVPREWFKCVSPLAAAIADEDAIVPPGYRRADEYPDYGDGARDCGCWDWVRDCSEQAPWKGFFVTTADLETYNRSGMANADPQAHRWCSVKLLFDYTPYATRSDWMHVLAEQRWMWENHEHRCLQLKPKAGSQGRTTSAGDFTCKRICWYAKNSEIWKHFSPEEWSRHSLLAERLGFGSSGGGESATEQFPTASEEPYITFRKSDWARNGIAAKLMEMPRSRREKHYTKVVDMAQCWPVPPTELLWVGGTYARHPKHFPEHQKELAWVYGKLRPLGIQPDTFLSKLHQAGFNRFAPVDLWHKTWDDDVMLQHFPGTLPDTVRAGKLWTYLETHKLHESLWYGHALRNKHKHHTSVLDHPLTDKWNTEGKSFFRQQRPLRLLTAPCLEAVGACAASHGFRDARGNATEHAAAIGYVHDEDTGSETSGASDYGTLA